MIGATQQHAWNTACRVSHQQRPDLEYMGQQWRDNTALCQFLMDSLPAGGDALELGVGGGRSLLKVVDHFRSVVAADVSAEMISDCRTAHGDFDGRVEYVLVDGIGLDPLAGRRFDLVYAVSVFVHLEYWQLFALLRQLPPLIKPGGCLVFDFVNPLVPGLLEKQADHLLLHHDMPWTFYRLITRDMLLVLLERAGFERERCEFAGDACRARPLDVYVDA